MKIKVLALSYLFPNKENPGYGIFVFNRLKAVAKQCDVKVIAPLQWFPFLSKYRRAAGSKRIGNYEKFGGLDVFYPSFLSIPKFFKWFDSVAYFLSVIPAVCHLKYKEKYDFDVVDVHWTYPDILAGYLLAKIYRKKLIVTIRGKEALCLGETGGRKIILDWCLKKADVVVALSTELEELVHQIGVSTCKTRVVHNGVNTETFNYLDKMFARRELSLPEDRKIILSVGSLIRRKGHHELINAMVELSSNIDIDLYIVGGINPEGDYSTELKVLVAEHGLKNVYFVDALSHEQLGQWYAAADLFCLATAGEGCPNVVLEAMACGCPVVVSAVGAVPDLIREEIDGLVVDLDSWNWIKSITQALSIEWNRKEISQNMGNKNWDTCASGVIDTYGEVLDLNNSQNQTDKIKIIYHHRTLGDGAEGIHIREMIKAFRDLGHQVLVIGPIGETNHKQKNSSGVLSEIKFLLPGFLFELCEMGYSLYSFVQLSWLIIKEKPDFVYDRYITFNAGCVFAAKLQKIPLFLEVNAPLALERSEQPDEKLCFKKVAFAIERWTCANSWKTIVVSTPLKEYLLSIGIIEDKIITMPNGVNPEKFKPHAKDMSLMKQLGINDSCVVIGFTGVLRAWHGLEMLLNSFSELSKKHRHLFLLIVGDGPIRGEFDQMIKEYDISENTRITGRVPYEEVHEYVNLFDIAVSPNATFYASPMKVIEYMALGKPVIVPKTQNFLDLIDNGVNGVSFNDGSLDDLTIVMNDVISEESLRNRLGDAARLKVENRLSWEWNAKAIIEFIIHR